MSDVFDLDEALSIPRENRSAEIIPVQLLYMAKQLYIKRKRRKPTHPALKITFKDCFYTVVWRITNQYPVESRIIMAEICASGDYTPLVALLPPVEEEPLRAG